MGTPEQDAEDRRQDAILAGVVRAAVDEDLARDKAMADRLCKPALKALKVTKGPGADDL